jgi:putative Mn2+ efflux pump MntP
MEFLRNALGTGFFGCLLLLVGWLGGSFFGFNEAKAKWFTKR